MHWAFYSTLWWTASLLTATIIYRKWHAVYGPGLKSEFAAMLGAILVVGFGSWATITLGLA